MPRINPSTGPLQELAEDAAKQPLEASIEFQRDNVFLLYASFCGDAQKTAFAADTTVDNVLQLAVEGRWDERLRAILELKKSQKPGDVERAMNRALNFVQAHRMRLILEAMIKRITALSPDQLREATTSYHVGKDGAVLSATLNTRPLADLAAALEKCHALSYAALSDTAADRKGRPPEDQGEESAGQMHARIAAAFAKKPILITEKPSGT